MSVSLRGIADGIVEPGEPLRIAVRLEAPSDIRGSIELSPKSGAWSDAVVVELTSVNGGAAVARAEGVGKPASPRATLVARKFAAGLWMISSEAMKRVAPGDYVVRSRLELSGTAGWNGRVESDEMPIQVVAISDAADRVVQRTINLAYEAMSAGRLEAAAAIVDPGLMSNPDEARLLMTRAEIALRAGNPLGALICLGRTSRTANSANVEPPSPEREELVSRARAAAKELTISGAVPPPWSWPPATVRAFPEAEMYVPVGPIPEAPAAASPPQATAPSAVNPVPSVPAMAAMPVPSAAVPTPPATSASGTSSPMTGQVVPRAEHNDSKFIADAAGQWAASATASSQYGNPRYGPGQATGAPNIALGMAGDNPDAWCPAEKSQGAAWLEVTFAHPVHAREVRVRQNNAPGAIVKIEVFEPHGATHTWWEGVDPFVAPTIREIAWFVVREPETPYLVSRVKISFNLAAVPGWKQIDAVQLVGVP